MSDKLASPLVITVNEETSSLPFRPAPRGRARLHPGQLYAVDGRDSFIYYGQIAPDEQLGFFRFRSERLAPDAALAADVVSRFSVALPSIGRALRSGAWMGLGQRELHPSLGEARLLVQWPSFTLEVDIWKGVTVIRRTTVDDPEIQRLEVMATYDAEHHVPARLQADFDEGPDAWRAGGSVLRERMKKEDRAARHPGQPWHPLPAEWIPVRRDV
jgi:hypothetical protein